MLYVPGDTQTVVCHDKGMHALIFEDCEERSTTTVDISESGATGNAYIPSGVLYVDARGTKITKVRGGVDLQRLYVDASVTVALAD